MSYQHFYRTLQAQSLKLFPSLKESPLDWEHLISPIELELPRLVRDRAQRAISALWRVSRTREYQATLGDEFGYADVAPRNHSVLMAYDFHTTEAGECSLVEVNTNASGFLLTSLLELSHEPGPLAGYRPLEMLAQAFRRELTLNGNDAASPAVAITDEDLLNQKMLGEFLMYRDWFTSIGWRPELRDSREFTLENGRLRGERDDLDFVYNRTTDFYFEDPQHETLRRAYLERAATFSPAPREYWLLADKQRLVQLSEPGFMEGVGVSPEDQEAIQDVLIPTYETRAFGSPEEIWAQRRSLFFKPKRSYGGKSVYRGESVSRKVFERLMAEDPLIQKFRPAQRVPIDDERSVLANWKFDLRFYVYEDRIQSVCARIYQGQVTNFSSPMGGYTRVKFRP